MRRVLRYITRLGRLAAVIVAIALVSATAVVVVAPQVGQIIGSNSSEHEPINLDALPQRSIMYDRYGNVMAVLSRENRVPVPLNQVSPKVIDAVLSVEDQHFYEHHGVNVRSIFRALRTNVDEGGVAQGGSTISQQVIKNSIVGDERTLERKLKEAVLAVELEKQLSKNEILERYLNTIYLGNNAYGVQAYAQTYFGKNAIDLDWAESALMAAMISNPSSYDPITHPVAAFKQRAIAVQRLVDNKRLSPDAAKFVNLAPLPKSVTQPPSPEGYFTQDVINRMLDDPRLGDTATDRYNAVYRGGLRVYTTFDPNAQAVAEQARNDTMPGGRGDGTFSLGPDPGDGHERFGTAAMVSIEPGTGAVRVMVGGVDPKGSSYNLADNTQGRQAGSSFKSFVLAAGIEQGLVPDDSVDGTSPCPGLPGYGEEEKNGQAPPSNFADSAGFVGTLTQQVQSSSNCAFLRLGQIVGIQNTIDMAKNLGVVDTPLSPYASAPLGTNLVSPFDMAAAYSVFANDGVKNEPYFIERVENSTGQLLFRHQADPQRVLSTETARLVNRVLKANVDAGTGTRAQLFNGQPAAGKTGTTEFAADVWFVGYTPQIATAVWMGGVEGNIPMTFGGGATGGVYAAATWGVYMSGLLANVPIVQFAEPGPPRPGKYVAIGIDNGLTGTIAPKTEPVPAPPTTLPPPVGSLPPPAPTTAAPPAADAPPTTTGDPTSTDGSVSTDDTSVEQGGR